MRLGIVVSDPEDWTAKSLAQAFSDIGAETLILNLSKLCATIGGDLAFREGESDLLSLDAIVVRDMGRGPPQEVAFRYQALTSLQEAGQMIVNSPEAILRAANKFATTVALQRAGVPTPETTVTSSLDEAVKAVERYGKAVSKPLFGYKGRDLALIEAEDTTPLKKILARSGVIYLQEFIGSARPRDIRAFVVGDDLVGAIYRVAPPGEWISNLARGGRAEICPISEELEDLAIRANRAVGTLYSGVDLLETPEGPMVIEVNGTPSGKGIFSCHGIDVGKRIAREVVSLLSQL